MVTPFLKISGCLVLFLIILSTGCAAKREISRTDPFPVLRNWPSFEDPAMTGLRDIDPEFVSRSEVDEILSRFPAPRVISINGSLPFVKMDSLARFLIGMGYPEESLKNPLGGLSYSGYMDGPILAGLFAWFYERDGLRPVLVGHSRGGMKVLEVMREFILPSCSKLRPWNPVTRSYEKRNWIRDPVTGRKRNLCGLSTGFGAALATGTFMRIVLLEWGSLNWLREVPPNIDDFLGVFIRGDLIGSDPLGKGEYRAEGKTVVRNLLLPSDYSHISLPETEHLLDDQTLMRWVDGYRPESDAPSQPQVGKGDADNILVGAEIWYYLKKHWVLELRRALRQDESRETQL